MRNYIEDRQHGNQYTTKSLIRCAESEKTEMLELQRTKSKDYYTEVVGALVNDSHHSDNSAVQLRDSRECGYNNLKRNGSEELQI